MRRTAKRLWVQAGIILFIVCFFQCEDWIDIIMGRDSFLITDMASVFPYLVFHRLDSTEPDITILVNATISIIMFNILYGSYLYDELHGTGIYYFIRYRNRMKWYIQKIMALLRNAFVFHMVYLGIQYIFSLNLTHETMSFHNFEMLISYTAYFTILCIMTALITNLLSVRFGRVIAFIVAYAVLGIMRWTVLAVGNATIFGTDQKIRALIPIHLTLDDEGFFTGDTYLSLAVAVLICCLLTGLLYHVIRSENIGLLQEESHV